jgi:hypothetical protein
MQIQTCHRGSIAFRRREQQLSQGRDPFLAKHRLWLSHYSSNPICPPNWQAPWIIQFTGDGIGPGPHQVPGIEIAGGVDLNHFGGSPAELKAQWAGQPVQPVQPVEPVVA